MQQAISLAKEAANKGDVPVGALVVDDSGTIIGIGANLREQDNDPTAHAEIVGLPSSPYFYPKIILDQEIIKEGRRIYPFDGQVGILVVWVSKDVFFGYFFAQSYNRIRKSLLFGCIICNIKKQADVCPACVGCWLSQP